MLCARPCCAGEDGQEISPVAAPLEQPVLLDRKDEQGAAEGAAPSFFAPVQKASKPVDKEEVQRRVLNYIKQAVRGVPVTVLRSDKQQKVARIDGTLRVKNDYEAMVVEAPGGLSVAYCNVKNITDVYSVDLDGTEAFSKPMLASLGGDELDRLLRVDFVAEGTRRLLDSAQGKKVESLYMIKPSVESRDACMETLKVLCTQANQKKTAED